MSQRARLIGGAFAIIAAAVIGFYGVRLSHERSAPAIVIGNESLSQPIAVQVSGAVATPGLYRLPPGSRVQDAIDAAGGTTEDADLSGINIARRLDDEEQLEIASNATAPPAAANSAVLPPVATAAAGAKININTASATELDGLPGIGPALAAKIVSYRTANGPFAGIEELSNVSGISPRMVDDMRGLITIGP